ncbi:hypothetical protein F0562_016542 [Nyssa sinensis]|uniref:Uncharacterized protein n=1 Tax=Nyssa sinensis TaxID=561372 RepID=A0A5J4ZE55_9ASTE|nr:hypothetical protein F0562_016542 [Nyssa sinensis]
MRNLQGLNPKHSLQGVGVDSLSMKTSSVTPASVRKNPVKHAVRHFGPPPGFSSVPSELVDESLFVAAFAIGSLSGPTVMAASSIAISLRGDLFCVDIVHCQLSSSQCVKGNSFPVDLLHY